MTVPDLKEAVENRLIWNWRAVLKRAWSVRLMVLAALLSGLEAALPFLDWLPVHKGVMAVLSIFVVGGALVARIVMQRGVHEE